MDKELTQKISDYFSTRPVMKAWVFGSYARGEQRPDSDIDIMIVPDRDAHVGLFMLSGMRLDLQDLLGVKENAYTFGNLLNMVIKITPTDLIKLYNKYTKGE